MSRMEENSGNTDALNEGQRRGRYCSSGQDLCSQCSSSGVNASVWPMAVIMGVTSLGCARSNPVLCFSSTVTCSPGSHGGLLLGDFQLNLLNGPVQSCGEDRVTLPATPGGWSGYSGVYS